MEGLKKKRLAAGLSRRDLAGKINTSPVSVFRWEKGMAFPRRKKLQKLAEIFKTTIDGLM